MKEKGEGGEKQKIDLKILVIWSWCRDTLFHKLHELSKWSFLTYSFIQ